MKNAAINFIFFLALLLSLRQTSSQEKDKRPPLPPGVQWEEFCPSLSVSCPETIGRGELLKFSANLSGPADLKPSYSWTISNGTIKEGQGTPEITIDTTELGNQCIKATLRVEGMRLGCPKTVSCTALVMSIGDPTKFDSYSELSLEDEKARLDNLALAFKDTSNTEIRIESYDGRRNTKGTARKRAERAKDYLIKSHGIAADRIVLREDKDRLVSYPHNKLTLDFYIVPREWHSPCKDQP